MKTVVVVGGGAAGMLVAGLAAKAGADVTLLEQNQKLGKRLYATGNGKCNLTNYVQTPDCYRTEEPVLAGEILRQLPLEETLLLFQKMGLVTKQRNGYVYPNCEQAAAVVAVLGEQLRTAGVQVMTGARLTELFWEKGGFRLRGLLQTEQPAAGKKKPIVTESSFSKKADLVVLATGGLAGQNLGTGDGGLQLAKQLGHALVAPVPALVPLRLQHGAFQKAAGDRLEAALTLTVGDTQQKETGEIVMTEYGISGIPVMQISRFASRALHQAGSNRPVLFVDFLPAYPVDSLCDIVRTLLLANPEATVAQALISLLPKRLLEVLLLESGISMTLPAKQVTADDCMRLCQRIKASKFPVTDTCGFEKAQVMSGGVSLAEVTEELESRRLAGLFFAGELLDVDGTCGGYNLQWAWSSAYTVANALKKRLLA